MFSGIVEGTASVVSNTPLSGGSRLVVDVPFDTIDCALGDSIALNGVCLTVVEIAKSRLSFDLAEETLRRSIFGSIKPGTRINFERSLKVGDRIHGHFVFGHVDATIELLEKCLEGNSVRLSWSLPRVLRKYFAEKGSVSINGVSLTVGAVSPDRFVVYVIPHTSERTTLGDLVVGDSANLEVDMLARYVAAMREVDQSE